MVIKQSLQFCDIFAHISVAKKTGYNNREIVDSLVCAARLVVLISYY